MTQWRLLVGTVSAGCDRRVHEMLARNFHPDEPRGWHGRWVGGAIHDALKLEGKADLQHGEHLVGSDKVAGHSGTIRMALVDHHGTKSLRLGIGDETFGSRDDEAGPWRAGPDSTAAINADRKKLTAEQASLEHELSAGHVTPARKAAIEKRLTELDNMDTSEVVPAGYTANIDQHSAASLRSTLADALAKGEQEAARRNAVFDEIERLTKEREPLRVMPTKWTPAQEAKWDSLTARIDQLQAEAGGFDYTVFAEGSVPGRWADVHYRVELDDPSVGVRVDLGAVPHGSGKSLSDLVGNQQGATLDPAETKKFIHLLDQIEAGA